MLEQGRQGVYTSERVRMVPPDWLRKYFQQGMGEWAGHYRIRTGDWRVIFRVVAPDVIVVRIRNRRDVYED